MARAARRTLILDAVVFLPTGAPKYRDAPVASGRHRVAMLELALKGKGRFRIDERELGPNASAYTVDTLKSLRKDLGAEAELYFLMGADQFAKFDTWREPETVRKLARLAVFARPGYEVKDKRVKLVPMAPMPVSASEVRSRIRGRKPWRSLVPPKVANYITRHRLYT
jgi:nicotinate-nucleotide adenylyltransferase